VARGHLGNPAVGVGRFLSGAARRDVDERRLSRHRRAVASRGSRCHLDGRLEHEGFAAIIVSFRAAVSLMVGRS
jgi:hypothetical protein